MSIERSGPGNAVPRALLCACNYPSGTGYAWDFIEGLYGAIAGRLAPEGIVTYVAYPILKEPPRTLAGSPAQAIELDTSLASPSSVEATTTFVRRHNVQALYLTDRPVWSTGYARLRHAGVRHIVVHDHASDIRDAPRGVRRAIKHVIARLPRIWADEVVAVSDYVARRQVQVGLTPASKITRVWNGVDLPPLEPLAAARLHATFGVDVDRPIVASACRLTSEKGVNFLLEAFALLMATWSGPRRPILIIMGDGPQLAQLQEQWRQLAVRDDVLMAGYRADAGELLAGADVCVVPSVWQDALPLAVMQPMARSRPVVASAVGGIPEMIIDGRTGVLVPPADPAALASGLRTLLERREWAESLGRAARERVAVEFSREQQIQTLTGIIRRGW